MKIHSLGYIGVHSTNPAHWSHYGTQVLGMMDNSETLRGEDKECVYLKMDDRPYRILVEAADQDRYAFSGWEVAGPKDFADAINTLEAHDVAYQQGSADLIQARQVQDLIQFADPQGNRHELYWGPVSDFGQFASPVGIKHFVTGDQGFGHVVLPAPDFDPTLDFYQTVMGFELSDLMKVRFTPDPEEPEKRLYFMHCNERHHSLAIMEAPNPTGCVHVMVEVNSVDEVGRAMDRRAAAGVKLTGTLGRHANDHMVSFYMATPSGFMVEYGAEGRTIADWNKYSPFQSTVNSFWGHDFSVGFE
ncbi:biphenyl 2,3-dioxygenase [Aestuariicella hydrocarbonica]|uniref:Biphenyl 2,3-dioxygenase n=1 Tax=Pseudomaricurvus hydrocarbonicus TaxID=1470433 RepID=A0A9E5JX22_9GAMM|nr:VOC family protein [Aestuariicella hydrocarbonica]NHO66075.1 biphenyl 2,3-dioxygenase [Aestuariicella hydrocarbonica]